MSRVRQFTIFDRALDFALRNKTIASLSQLVCEHPRVTALDLYQQRIFANPPQHTFAFIPIMPINMLRYIVHALAREERMRDSLNTLAKCEDRMGQSSMEERGYVFEEFHAHWYLAMKGHQARKSFLKDFKLPWDDQAVRLCQDELLSGRQKNFESPMRYLERTLPHCQMRDLYNNTDPISSSQVHEGSQMLLFERYSIKEVSKPAGKVSNALDVIPDALLHELLLGRIYLRNIPYGAGYDYLEVNWHLSEARPRLTFDFIEMKYSSPFSSSELKHEDVMHKYKWVHFAFEKIKKRLPRNSGVDFDFRLIFCSWRPNRSDLPIELLPPNILIYPLEKLSQAYGPSITSQSPFNPIRTRTTFSENLENS